VDAYDEIATVLPQLRRLEEVFAEDYDMKFLLSQIYETSLLFHRVALLILYRQGQSDIIDS
jgi:hypothetical protein